MGEKPEGEGAERKAGPKQVEEEVAGGGGAGDPAGLAVSDAGTPADKPTSSSHRGGGPGEPPEPEDAVNLNSSKSNAYRSGGGTGSPEPEEATNLNSSRSNIYRSGGPGGRPPAPPPPDVPAGPPPGATSP